MLLVALPLQAAPPFVVDQTDGKTSTGSVTRLSGDWSLTLDQKTFNAQSWLGVRQANTKLPALPEGRQILLHNGNRLTLGTDALRLVNEKLQFTHPHLSSDKALSIDLSRIAILWLSTPQGSGRPESIRRRLLQAKREQDVVVLRNGDQLTGLLSALDDKSLQLESRKRTAKVEISKVALIAFSTELADRLSTKDTYAHVVLSGGDRLALKKLSCSDGKVLTGETFFGGQLKAPLEKIASVTVMNGSAIYLSQLKPVSYEHKPWLDLSWPLGVDESDNGTSLQFKDGTYDFGLGMHSPSKVTYLVPEKAKRFQAKLGMDVPAGRLGSVQVRILVDGKDKDLSLGEITSATAPIDLNVDVTGAQRITLIVDTGKRGDLGDHVNWVNARFVK